MSVGYGKLLGNCLEMCKEMWRTWVPRELRWQGNIFFYVAVHSNNIYLPMYYRFYGWEEGMYRVLVGKLEGKRPLGRPRRRWVDDIRTNLQEVGCGYMDWVGLTQDRDRWRTLVSAVMNLRVPWNAGDLLTSCKPVSFPRRTLHHGVSK